VRLSLPRPGQKLWEEAACERVKAGLGGSCESKCARTFSPAFIPFASALMMRRKDLEWVGVFFDTWGPPCARGFSRDPNQGLPNPGIFSEVISK
jgi:hypothetical protein